MKSPSVWWAPTSTMSRHFVPSHLTMLDNPNLGLENIMAAYFQLFPKGSTEAATFTSVDEAICAHLDIPVDPVKYAFGWYDSIGLAIALGHSFEWMRTNFEMPETLRIIDFLEANYTTDHWMGR